MSMGERFALNVLIAAQDADREAAARPTPCCAPTMCPTCWDNGGHAPPRPTCALCGSADDRGGPPRPQPGYLEPLHDTCRADLARYGSH